MRLMCWKQNEGPTDAEFKRGDIFQVHPNTWTPGTEETRVWLVVEVPNYGGDLNELVAGDFTVGSSPEEVVPLHLRKYYIDFDAVLNAGEKDKWLDPKTQAPIITGRFTLDHILRR